MRCAAFNTGTEFHLLDHIAPLAEVLSMPLITTEETNYQLARRYYPNVETRLMPDLEFQLGQIAEEFDALFECKYWGAYLKPLFQQLYKKEMRLVFCPHGQSDKGYLYPGLAQYALQDIVLLYGPLLIEMLQELEVWPQISRYAMVGNYRRLYYQNHRAFYDGLAEEEVFSRLPKNRRTLLYAPTWKDADQATSFFSHGARVIQELPSDWNLIVKLHPLLEQRDPGQFYALSALLDKKSNAVLAHEFPPVYPLLSRADVYLGDFSSVGYDFLSFGRPLYFFPTGNPRRLHACGQMLDLSKNLYGQMEAAEPLAPERQALYRHAFGDEIDLPDVARNVREIIHSAQAE